MRGANHPQHRHGQETYGAKAERAHIKRMTIEHRRLQRSKLAA